MNSVTKDHSRDRDMPTIMDHELSSSTIHISSQDHLNVIHSFQDQQHIMQHSFSGSSTAAGPMSGHNTPVLASLSGHGTPGSGNLSGHTTPVPGNLSGQTTPVPGNRSGHTTPISNCHSGHTTPIPTNLSGHSNSPVHPMSGHSTPISHLMEDSSFQADKQTNSNNLPKIEVLHTGVLIQTCPNVSKTMDRLRPGVLISNIANISDNSSSSVLPSVVINEVEMNTDNSDQWQVKEHPGHEFIRVIQSSPNEKWRTQPSSSGCIVSTSSSNEGGGVIIRDVTLAQDPNSVKREQAQEEVDLNNAFIPPPQSSSHERQTYSTPPILTPLHQQQNNHIISPLQDQVKSEPSISTSPINISVQLPTVTNQHDGLGYRVLISGESGTQELDQLASHIVDPSPSHQIDSLGTTTLHGSGINEGVTYTTLETAPLSTIQYSDSYFYYKNELYPKEENRRPYEYPPPPTYLGGPSQTHPHSNPYLQKLEPPPGPATPVWGIPGHNDYSQDYMDRGAPFHSYMSTGPPSIAWSHTYDPSTDQTIGYTYRIESSDPDIMEKKECIQCGSLTTSSFQRDPGGSIVCTDCSPYYKNGTVNRPHVRAQRRGTSPVGPVRL